MAAKKKLEVLNVSEFAKLMGVASNSVTKWITTGKISQRCIEYSKAGKPQIIVDYAVPELKKNETVGAVRKTKTGHNLGGNTKPQAKVTPQATPADVARLLSFAGVTDDGDVEVAGMDMTKDPLTFEAAKIQEQIGKAMKIKLEVKEKRGLLVDKAEMEKQLAELGINLRGDLATIADRVAANCVADATEHGVRQIIHSAIEKVLLKYTDKVWPSTN